MLKIDLHTHTADDPIDHIPYSTYQLIDRAATLGYGALAITLHERQLDVRPLAGYAADRGIVLIPGVERSIEGKHVLLLNFERGAEDVRTFADLARLRGCDGRGLVVAPHPYFPARSCLRGRLDRHAEVFDAVEWNAMFTRTVNFNARAERWAARHGKPIVANGDVHRLHQLGTCYSLVAAAPEPDAICEAIRAGRVSIRCEPLSAGVAAATMADLVLGPIASILTRPAVPLPARS